MDWSPAGRHIAAACVDYTVRLFDVAEGRCIYTLADHAHFVQGVAWDPAGLRLASMSTDRTCLVYAVAGADAASVGSGPWAVGASAGEQEAVKPAPLMFGRPLKLERLPAGLMPRGVGTGISSATVTDVAVGEAATTNAAGKPGRKPQNPRIFHDETLTCFFRRLAFSPDGQLLCLPAGVYNDAPALFFQTAHGRWVWLPLAWHVAVASNSPWLPQQSTHHFNLHEQGACGGHSAAQAGRQRPL